LNWFEAIVLGLVQGLTEFLPVSSSGHLEIVKSLFGIDPDASFAFTVAVHGATVLSTLVVFRKEIWDLITGSLKLRMNEETSYVIKLIISMIPVGIIGFLFMDFIKKMFNGNVAFVGYMLIITAVLLALAHFISINRKGRNIGYLDALIIGIAQAIAVIPGISRSGSTIATGLLIGNRKDEIARFSFLMVLVPVIGGNLVEVISTDANMNTGGFGVIVIGFAVAFVSGYLACRWMISIVKKSKLIWFAIYCALAGSLAVVLS
jgi:undecaprenyl-diphosphatase